MHAFSTSTSVVALPASGTSQCAPASAALEGTLPAARTSNLVATIVSAAQAVARRLLCAVRGLLVTPPASSRVSEAAPLVTAAVPVVCTAALGCITVIQLATSVLPTRSPWAQTVSPLHSHSLTCLCAASETCGLAAAAVHSSIGLEPVMLSGALVMWLALSLSLAGRTPVPVSMRVPTGTGTGSHKGQTLRGRWVTQATCVMAPWLCCLPVAITMVMALGPAAVSPSSLSGCWRSTTIGSPTMIMPDTGTATGEHQLVLPLVVQLLSSWRLPLPVALACVTVPLALPRRNLVPPGRTCSLKLARATSTACGQPHLDMRPNHASLSDGHGGVAVPNCRTTSTITITSYLETCILHLASSCSFQFPPSSNQNASYMYQLEAPLVHDLCGTPTSTSASP